MSSGQRGFSLLEVLVAFVILALALGVLMRIFSGGVQNTSIAEHYARATIMAESRLAEVGMTSPLTEGEHSGEEADYRWRTTISTYSTDADPGGSLTMPVALYQVEVVVTWDQDRNQPRQVRLLSLRAGPAA